MEENIIEAFKTQSNNTVPVLSKQFNVPERTIHRVLNNYFKSKNQ